MHRCRADSFLWMSHVPPLVSLGHVSYTGHAVGAQNKKTGPVFLPGEVSRHSD